MKGSKRSVRNLAAGYYTEQYSAPPHHRTIIPGTMHSKLQQVYITQRNPKLSEAGEFHQQVQLYKYKAELQSLASNFSLQTIYLDQILMTDCLAVSLH